MIQLMLSTESSSMRVAKLFVDLTDFIFKKRKLKKGLQIGLKDLQAFISSIPLLIIMMLCPLELVNLSLLL